ncbi:hypothetical protein ED312_23445 [Sinomicrobium pectinilyticum]|uniref:Uncharacterized protein n=1 Tax=Sinomicrobium pectinilyticum TaxID=1084421 RepID=A0A3N0CY10_SINP1|nr:hypothetical protein [Sinomicrobium pectinilyticum]RNL68036.1 hypothetical protein ED312_23445 [Sinomicrobium pectinilyticum]
MHVFILSLLFCLFPVLQSLSQPVIMVKYSDNPETIKHEVRQYMKYLDIRENIHLTVCYNRHIPGGMLGVTFRQNTSQPDGYRHIIIRIDPRLNAMRRRLVLAHEMVHVKQYAKKELIPLNKNHIMWEGKKYRAYIYDRQTPWEAEAYKTDRLLTRRFRKEKTASPPFHLPSTTPHMENMILKPQEVSCLHTVPLIKSCNIPGK